MSQIKEQTKTPEKLLNKIETNTLLDAEFKTLVITILKELRGRVDDLRENFNSDRKHKKWRYKTVNGTIHK